MLKKFKNALTSSPVTYNKKVPNPKATELEVNGWELSDVILKKVVPSVGVHPFPLNELQLMSAAAVRFRPKYIFDWGTHIGKSARVFYEVCQALDISSQIHSIDLPDEIEHVEHPHDDRGKLVKGKANVHLHQGDGLDTSLEVLAKAKTVGKRPGDVLYFVDGDHSYESVKRELTGIIKKVPTAAILLHDTFYQSADSGYNIGPHEAIKECLAKTRRKYKVIETRTGLPGMTLLYPLS